MKALENKEKFSKAKDCTILNLWILCMSASLKARGHMLEGIPLLGFRQTTISTVISQMLPHDKKKKKKKGQAEPVKLVSAGNPNAGSARHGFLLPTFVNQMHYSEVISGSPLPWKAFHH